MVVCYLIGAYLTEVESSPENEFLLRLCEDFKITSNGPWFGASDEDTEGQWIWAKSGEALK